MSGGVDSSVAAFLLKEDGYEVIGVTALLLPAGDAGGEERCCSARAIEDAKGVAERLGIEHRVLDLKEDFKRNVIDYFCGEYSKGRTPNPCIICNQKIKFGLLLNRIMDLNADYLATGHYAKISYDISLNRYYIGESKDNKKDQTYFLFNLGQKQLSRVLFPLGGLTKKEVRRIAEDNHLEICGKPDSQDICFIANGNYREFIKDKITGAAQGKVVDTEGKTLGRHKGVAFYTIGQREGLGIAAERPLYIVRIDAEKNEIVLGESQDAKKKEFTASGVSWMAIEAPSGNIRAKAKIRYNQTAAECVISPISKTDVKVTFDQPQYAVTPGQAAVFYDEGRVLGGGWIE